MKSYILLGLGIVPEHFKRVSVRTAWKIGKSDPKYIPTRIEVFRLDFPHTILPIDANVVVLRFDLYGELFGKAGSA